MCGADFGGVGDSQGLEDTPWNTNEHLSDQELDKCLGEEDDEDESRDANKATNHGLAVSESLGNDTVEEQTGDLTNKRAVAETSLPRRSQLIAAVGLDFTKLALENVVGVEVADEGLVETLHDDGGAEEERPHDGPGVKLDRCHEAHTELGFGRFGRLTGEPGGVGIGDGHAASGLRVDLDGLGRRPARG